MNSGNDRANPDNVRASPAPHPRCGHPLPLRRAEGDGKQKKGAPVTAQAQSTIRKVGIIGAGQMGNGIAHVVALAGYDVAINDLKREAFDKAYGIIEKNMARQVSKGLIKDDVMRGAMKRITYAENAAALADADIVIEAATEDEAVKKKIFSDLCPKLKKSWTPRGATSKR